MRRRILILRPEPGASLTAARARAADLDPVVSPLFTIRPLPWQPPAAADFDALLLTSGNAARHSQGRYADLPCYAVGEATAEAARQAGYRDIRVGPSDGAAVAAMMAAAGVGRALHLCGRDHLDLAAPGLVLERRLVYAAEPAAALSGAAREALADRAPALLHSPRSAALFARLVDERSGVAILAISRAAADAAGEGWGLKQVAAAPRDEALLELAVQLCQTGGTDETGNGG